MEIAPEEEFLTARCTLGEPAAFDSLAHIYGARLYGFIRCALPARAQVWENLAVRTLAICLKQLHPFDEKVPLSVLMMKRIVEILDKEAAGTAKDDEASFSTDPRLAWIRKSIYSLPLEDRYYLLLRDQMDFSQEEMAFILGLSEETVKARLTQVRQKFHQTLHALLSARKS